jgi:tripartite ATP-independent transporter DctP family solute receptor
MKKMKKLLCAGLSLVMIAQLAACGGGNGTNNNNNQSSGSNANANSPSSSSAVVIKLSLSQAVTEPTVIAANAFKEEVEEKSGGSIEVQVYPDNQIGNERDAVEGMTLHTVQMVAPANAVITNFIPEFNIFSLPMIFRDKQHIYDVLDNVGMDEYYQNLCEQSGFKLLGWFDLGSRNIMTVSKPINSIDDIKGLKIRNQESTVEMDGMASFGASPTSMSYNELYTALSSSVIDGAEAANTNYYAKAFYEVAPNWAIVGWLECVNPVLMDLTFWNNLSAEQQAVLEEACQNMVDLERQLYAQSEDDALAELEKMDGVNITYPDRAPFEAAAKTCYDQYADQLGGMDKIQAIIDYGK